MYWLIFYYDIIHIAIIMLEEILDSKYNIIYVSISI